MAGSRPFVEPEDGTEAFEIYLETEGCSVTNCRIEATDPFEAAELAGDADWCPGWCRRLAEAMGGNTP